MQAAELCAVGSLLGLAQSLGGTGLVKLHQLRDPSFQPTAPLPDMKRASTGLAAYMGLVANIRYQLVSGADRLFFHLHSANVGRIPSWQVVSHFQHNPLLNSEIYLAFKAGNQYNFFLPL